MQIAQAAHKYVPLKRAVVVEYLYGLYRISILRGVTRCTSKGPVMKKTICGQSPPFLSLSPTFPVHGKITRLMPRKSCGAATNERSAHGTRKPCGERLVPNVGCQNLGIRPVFPQTCGSVPIAAGPSTRCAPNNGSTLAVARGEGTVQLRYRTIDALKRDWYQTMVSRATVW